MWKIVASNKNRVLVIKIHFSTKKNKGNRKFMSNNNILMWQLSSLMEVLYMIGKLNKSTAMMEKALDAAWLRNEAISNNIANVNTPGYKKSYVKFEEFLSDSQFQISGNRKGDKYLPIGKDTVSNVSPQVVTEENTSMRRDGNNVDIDVEMAELAKNTIKYNALITQMTKEFSKIKLAINGGR